jgi:hypothetical protein
LSFLNAEPPSDAAKERLAAFDEFMAAMHACPEEFPEFERAQLHREAAL